MRKAVLLSVIIMVLVAQPIFAGGKPDVASQDAAAGRIIAARSWETDTSPITLEIFVDLAGQWGDWWGRDPVSQHWIKETGVNLNFMTAADATHQQLNIMIAARDYPDMIMLSQTLPQIRQLASNNMIWELDVLAGREAPGFLRYMMEDNPHIVLQQRVMYDSNHFYFAPFRHLPLKYFNSPFAVRNTGGISMVQQIYEELGSPAIRNADDFLALLRRVRQAYPQLTPMQSYRLPGADGDGNPPLVTHLLPVGGLARRYYQKPDGTWYKYWEHEDFIKVLKLANTLYNERLIDPAEFTMSQSDLRAKIYNGNIFSELNRDSDNLDTHNRFLAAAKPGWNYKMIGGITIDPSRMKYESDLLAGGFGQFGIVIPKSSKNADRTIRFLDYLYQDEVQKQVMFGLEGSGHEMRDGLPYFTQAALDAQAKGLNDLRLKLGVTAYFLFRDDFWQKVNYITTASKVQAEALAATNAHYADLSFNIGADVFPSNSEEQRIAATIKDYYESQIMSIIMGPPARVDAEFQTLLTQIRRLGLDKLNAYWTKFFKERDTKRAQYSQGLRF
jgi:putative aldouronate transport system substrate-binding protein